MDEKWLLEQTAAEYFVATINDLYATSFQILAHLDKPDILIGDAETGHRIGIEVTHLFYNSEEARILLGKMDQDKSDEDNDGPDDILRFIERLNKLLEQKAEKARGYDHGYDLALLIRVVSPVFGKRYFDSFEGWIRVPSSEYNHIWLLFFDFRSRKWNLIKTLK